MDEKLADFKRHHQAALDALYKMLDIWEGLSVDELDALDKLIEYPHCFPSFDELVAEFAAMIK